MTGITCRQATELLALGEPGAADHVAQCPACANESSRIEALVSELKADGSAEVPAWLDHRVRCALTEAGGRPMPVRGQVVALGVSMSALLALVGGLSVLLAGSPVGALAPAAAYVLVIAYMMVGAAATLPLLRYPPRMRRR